MSFNIRSTNQESFRWSLLPRMELQNKFILFMIFQDQVLQWVCIMLMNQSLHLLMHVLASQLIESSLYTFPLKTPFWKNMMVVSRIFSKKFMILSIRNNSRPKKSGMSIDSLMIWSHMLWRGKSNHLFLVMVVMFGLARIMMVMFNLIP